MSSGSSTTSSGSINLRYDAYPTGRKHCSKCGCWRPLFDFFPDTRRGSQRLASWCKTCHRIYRRKREGHQPEQLGFCRNGHRRTPENTGVRPDGKRYCKVCHRAYGRSYQRGKKYREYDRIYREVKRREAGTPPRKRLEHRSAGGEQLDPTPFAAWLTERVKRHGPGEVAVMTGMSDRRVRSLIHGDYPTVSIDTVDRALIDTDTGLWELYPELCE